MKKKIFFLVVSVLCFTLVNNLFAQKAEPVRVPFVQLTVSGVDYLPGQEIPVRPGEKIIVKAMLYGGKRDYCMMPEKYANIGKNTIVESKGESGMSFNVNGGQFRGVWSLKKETAGFVSDAAVIISMLDAVMNSQNEAEITIPLSGFSNIFLKVTGQTDWHYIRNTPAGKKEEDETNKGTSTFYLKIVAETGVWYSSANISAKGDDNFRIRTKLDEVQRFYNETEQRLKSKDFSGAKLMLDNLFQAVSQVKIVIDEEKQKNTNMKCDVSFIGLPTDFTVMNIKKMQIMSDKWKDMFIISQGNVTKINDMLLKVQDGFSANVLRSVFKNYINWGTSIPTGAYDLLVIYDPNNILTPAYLPQKVLSWYSDAQGDASILTQQVRTIKMLSELRTFYLSRMQNFTTERKVFVDIINELKPAEELNNSAKSKFQSLGWASWKSK